MDSGKISGSSTDNSELLKLCIGTGFAFAVFSMVSPIVPLLLVDLKATPGLLGLVVSFSTIGSLILAVPAGFLINSWGSRLMMQRSGALFAVSCFFISMFPSISGLFTGLFFLEIGKLIFILGAQSHVANLGEGRDLNLDFGWYGTSAAVGQMAGPAMAGFLIDNTGHRLTWIVIGVMTAVIILVFPRILVSGEIKKSGTAESVEGKKKKGFKHFLSVYALIAILASFAVLFADGARHTFYPVLLRQYGYSATVIGIYLSLRALMSVSVRFYMALIVKAAGGRFPALIVSIFILSIGIGTTPFCRSHFLLAVNAVLVGIGLGLALPLSMATVSEGVASEDRGIAMGIRLTGNRLAQLINPVFFGLIAQSSSLGVSFVSGGFMLFASAVPILLWWRGEKRQTRI